MISARPRRVLFRLAAAGAAFATLFHATAVTVPAFATIAYPPTYPAWRHVLFILIDGNLVWLLLRPPTWLVWPYAVLTLQVLNGHGRSAWEQWHSAGRIDGISVAAVLGIPLVLALLLADWRERRARGQSARSAGGRPRSPDVDRLADRDEQS